MKSLSKILFSIYEREEEKMRDLVMTDHARLRAAQRGIGEAHIQQAIDLGRCYYRTGILFYCIGKNELADLGKYVRNRQSLRYLRGLTVLAKKEAEDKLLILSVYKNQEAFSTIKRKAKRSSQNK
jgi:hypothetical protein